MSFPCLCEPVAAGPIKGTLTSIFHYKDQIQERCFDKFWSQTLLTVFPMCTVLSVGSSQPADTQQTEKQADPIRVHGFFSGCGLFCFTSQRCKLT